MQTNKKMNEYLDVSFRRIVENLDQAILVLGGDLVESPAVEYANPAFARWVGAHNDEIAGNSLAFLFAPEDREYLMQTLLMTIETGRDQVASLGFVGLDRHHRKIDFIVKPFHRKMGAPVSCMLIERPKRTVLTWRFRGINLRIYGKLSRTTRKPGCLTGVICMSR